MKAEEGAADGECEYDGWLADVVGYDAGFPELGEPESNVNIYGKTECLIFDSFMYMQEQQHPRKVLQLRANPGSLILNNAIPCTALP